MKKLLSCLVPGLLCLLLVLLATTAMPAAAHLDPPGPPAFQEVVWLLGVNVTDDMDHGGGAGELWLDWQVNQPGHAGDATAGRLPAAGTVAVNAPPAAPFPAVFPVLLYNHLNCHPLERPLGILLTLNDDDGPFAPDSSPLGLGIVAQAGVFGVVNGQFAYTVQVMVVPQPGLNPLCENPGLGDEQQPAVPEAPPPSYPAPGDTYSFGDGLATAYDEMGNVLWQTTITGQAELLTQPELAATVVVDEVGVQFLLENEIVAAAETAGRAEVVAGAGVWLVGDDAGISFFDLAGGLINHLPTAGRPSLPAAALVNETAIYLAQDTAAVYVLDGVGQMIAGIPTSPAAELTLYADRFTIVDANLVSAYSLQGQLIGLFDLAASAQVITNGNRIIVIDNDSVDIYDLNANLIRHAPTDGRASVLVSGDRIIIIDDNSVDIYDRNGNLIRHVPTDGRATVKVDGDRIIVIDDDSVSIYDKDGNLIKFVLTDGRADVVVTADRIIIIDNDSVSIYDRNGNLIKFVLTDGRATVKVDGDRIIIIDDDSVSIYDKDGNLIKFVLTDGRADVIVTADRIIIIDNDSVDIYDRNGNLLRHVPTDGRATVKVDGDRIIIIDDDSVDIYDKDGNLIRHVPTDGKADVLVHGDRIIINDDDAVDIYDRDGNLIRHIPTENGGDQRQRAPAAPNARALVALYESRIATADAHSAAVYDLDGNRLVYALADNIAALGFSDEQLAVTDANGAVTYYPLFGLLYRAYAPTTVKP